MKKIDKPMTTKQKATMTPIMIGRVLPVPSPSPGETLEFGDMKEIVVSCKVEKVDVIVIVPSSSSRVTVEFGVSCKVEKVDVIVVVVVVELVTLTSTHSLSLQRFVVDEQQTGGQSVKQFVSFLFKNSPCPSHILLGVYVIGKLTPRKLLL